MRLPPTAPSVAFLSDGKSIVFGSSDKCICVWDAKTGDTVLGLSDLTICVWNAETCEMVFWSLQGPKAGVRSISFTSDGKQITSGSDGGCVHNWDVQTDEILCHL